MPSIEEVSDELVNVEEPAKVEEKEKTYDEMTNEEREIRDKVLKAKEDAEQASKRLSPLKPTASEQSYSASLPMEARAWRVDRNGALAKRHPCKGPCCQDREKETVSGIKRTGANPRRRTLQRGQG
jgi:hypothetical protein